MPKYQKDVKLEVWKDHEAWQDDAGTWHDGGSYKAGTVWGNLKGTDYSEFYALHARWAGTDVQGHGNEAVVGHRVGRPHPLQGKVLRGKDHRRTNGEDRPRHEARLQARHQLGAALMRATDTLRRSREALRRIRQIDESLEEMRGRVGGQAAWYGPKIDRNIILDPMRAVDDLMASEGDLEREREFCKGDIREGGAVALPGLSGRDRTQRGEGLGASLLQRMERRRHRPLPALPHRADGKCHQARSVSAGHLQLREARVQGKGI